jgi:hypothetical protein
MPASSYSASATTWRMQEGTRVSRATPDGGLGRTGESLRFVKSLLETQMQSIEHVRMRMASKREQQPGPG